MCSREWFKNKNIKKVCYAKQFQGNKSDLFRAILLKLKPLT